MELLKTTLELSEECAESAEVVNQTKRNLIESRRQINEKLLDAESKLRDITDRHDRKTELLAKLEIKNFILMTEIERLNS